MPAPSPTELLENESARALLAALEQLGGEASPGELAAAAGLGPATVTKWLGRLREAALVEGPKRRIQLTPEGWAAAGRPAIAPGESLQLGEAIARMPTEAHRAFLRLALSATVARWHLGARRREAHAGFIAGGATGTGKTSLARFVSDAFGLDWALVRIQLRTATAGEVLGRLEQTDAGYAFRPSPLLAQPLIIFDEFDKADRPLQRDALVCFQGDTRAAREGVPFDIRATPMLTANKQGQLPIPPEYRRRSIVLDTDPLAGLLADIDLRLRELENAGGPPRLDLAALAPPAAELPPKEFLLLRETLRAGLTDHGWQLCDPRSVELMALGAAGGVAAPDLAALALQASVDYLTCAETVGETREAWRRQLPGQLAGQPLEALERGASDSDVLAAGQRRQIAEHAGDSIALTGERQAFAEELNLARPDARRFPPSQRPTAKALNAQLAQLRRQALAARSADALSGLREIAGPLIAEAERLHRTLEADQQRAIERAAAEVTEKRQRRTREREQRTREREQLRAAKQRQASENATRRRAAAAELASVRTAAKQLERLWARGSARAPLQVLTELRVDDRPLLIFEDHQLDMNSRLERVLAAVAVAVGHGLWRSPFDPSVQHVGTRSTCEALEAWGDGSRQVLAPALRLLHRREDKLLAAAGGAARKRPALG